MQGKSLECGLTQSQIKRILRGEELSASLMADVEQHLKACDDCQNFLDSTKLELAAQIASRTQAGAAAAPKKPAPAAAQPKRKPVKKAVDAYQPPAPPAGLKNTKTVALSIGLAAVLILMSTILRDPTKLFGPRAISTSLGEKALKVSEEPKKEVLMYTDEELAAKEAEENAAHTDEGHEEAPAAEDEHHEPAAEEHHAPADEHHSEPAPKKPAPSSGGQDLLIADGDGAKVTPHPKPEPEPKPKPAAKPAPRKPASRPKTSGSRPAASAPKPKPATSGGSGIKVYDKDGNPINP